LPDSNHEALRQRLSEIVREAGNVALLASKKPLRRWTKGGSSPVCEADIAVNDFLAKRLPPLAPKSGWLSEESDDDPARLKKQRLWIVDPIDGTRAYLEGRADWSVAVALAENGRPVVAALFAPVTNDLFLAAHGFGATHNGMRMQANRGDTLNGARLAGPQRFLSRLADLNPRIVVQPKVSSLALRLARVGNGEFDIALAGRNSHDWDLAAADLLVHEAGGVMTDLNGETLCYNRAEPVHGALVAAGPERHATLIDFLRQRQGEFA
jgi:myo-inositol-1(or 4)-monophosphatase